MPTSRTIAPTVVPTVVLLLCADRNYERPLYVTLASVLKALEPGWQVRVYIGTPDHAPVDRAYLEQGLATQGLTSRLAGLELLLVNLASHESKLGSRPDLPSGTYLRLLAIEQIPSSEGRVIYLDCDTLVQRSLHRLWQESLTQPVGAARDANAGLMLKRRDFHLIKGQYQQPRRHYFNAGMLYIDLQRWRGANVSPRLWSILLDNRLYYCDQDAINVVLQNEIQTIDSTWNWQYYHRRDWLLKVGVEIGAFLRDRRDPAVIHFVEHPKPWTTLAQGMYVAAYQEYFVKITGMPIQKTGFIPNTLHGAKRGTVLWAWRWHWAERHWFATLLLFMPAAVALLWRLRMIACSGKPMWQSWLIPTEP